MTIFESSRKRGKVGLRRKELLRAALLPLKASQRSTAFDESLVIGFRLKRSLRRVIIRVMKNSPRSFHVTLSEELCGKIRAEALTRGRPAGVIACEILEEGLRMRRRQKISEEIARYARERAGTPEIWSESVKARRELRDGRV